MALNKIRFDCNLYFPEYSKNNLPSRNYRFNVNYNIFFFYNRSEVLYIQEVCKRINELNNIRKKAWLCEDKSYAI